MGMGGPDPAFATPEDLQIAIDRYFALADTKDWPYTIEDLCLELGGFSRFYVSELARDKPQFSHAVARARSRIAAQRVRNLVHRDNHNVNGMKFDLINNFGYTEESKIKQEHSGPGGQKIVFQFIDPKKDEK